MALYSYMITNRTYPWSTWSEYIYPTAAGTLFYFMAPGANNINAADYLQINANAVPPPMPSSVQSSLEADIESTGPRGQRQVTLYIHGLANYLTDACGELGQFGQNLAAKGYKGLLIGFSWPSYGEGESWKSYSSLPYSFPPTAEYGTIRDNIQGSTQSLLNLLQMLKALCTKTGAQLNVMSHSEGNYMLMLAMYARSLHSDDPALPEAAAAVPLIDQVLLVAADINTGALTKKTPSQSWAAQGWWINNYSNAVTIYWSTHDDKLPWADRWIKWHNPEFPKRLGLWGPDTTAAGLLSNASAVDCSLVAKASNPNVGPNGVHESYFYIPQILADMTQTLNNVPPSQVTDRVSIPGSVQQYQMIPSFAPALAPAYEPRSARLPKKVHIDKGGVESR